MTVRQVDTLARRWTEIGVLTAVENGLDAIGFTQNYVDAVTARVQLPTGAKVIKDQIWGMIEVDQACLRIIDSPLLQKMRAVKQTGFSYLTYPPAEHSRFSHSLGMMHVVSRFLDAMKRHPTAGQPPAAVFQYWQVDDGWPKLLRHAALLHDIGHMPFSHVTETILEADRQNFLCGRTTVEDFLFEVEDCLAPPKEVHFSECLSLAIILTQRFRKFYNEYVDRQARPDDVQKIVSMIIGIPPEEGMPGLSGIISGPSIDADKIDYINRDAAACGIPIGVDVSRLFLRSAFITVQPRELQRLRHSPTLPLNPETIFVVNASGLDSIEEIGQARTALYHRVYLHQTTRNAERLLARAIHAATSNFDIAEFDPTNVMDIWAKDDFGLLNILAISRVEETRDLARRLLSRSLPKRGCVFGRNYTRPSYSVSNIFPKMNPKARKNLAKQITGTALDGLKRKQLMGAPQRQFEMEIADEMTKVAAAIRSVDGICPAGRPGVITVLPMSNLEPNRSDCIVLESRRLNSTAVSSISDEQLEAADIAKSVGYVMTDWQWREISFIATRSVLYRRRSSLANVALQPFSDGEQITVQCSSSILIDAEAVVARVGLDSDQLHDAMDAADRGGYFDDAPRLAPFDISDEQLYQAASHFSEFSGEGNWTVSMQTVKSFIEQIPRRLRAKTLTLFPKFKVLEKSEVVSAIREKIKERPKPTGGHQGFIIGLSPDSGNTARMHLENNLKESLRPLGWEFKKTLRDVLDEADKGDDLILCDDNVTSGSQALCQFMAWLGVPEAEWTEEQRQEQGIERSPLARQARQRLTGLRITIVSAVGTAAGGVRLGKALPEIGISSFQGLHYGSEASDQAVDLDELAPFFADVGKELLAWGRYGQSDFSKLTPEQRALCERDALGSGGAKALMCTPTNVPVGTIPAFWCPGLYRGEPWCPLLLRRGYLKRLVLA